MNPTVRSELMDREKMATLKYYSVDSDGKIQRLRRECPSETCGAGIFMAFHKDRQYCGKCHTTCMDLCLGVD